MSSFYSATKDILFTLENQDFQILDLIAPDFRLISGQVHYVSGHKNFHKLHRHVRKNVTHLIYGHCDSSKLLTIHKHKQLIWLVDNMTKKAHGTDVPLLSQIYVYLMRQIRGGSLEPDHIAYANDILDLVDGNVYVKFVLSLSFADSLGKQWLVHRSALNSRHCVLFHATCTGSQSTP